MLKNVKIQTAIVFVVTEDNRIHQVHIDQMEHIKTILHVCAMNNKKALKLGKTDFSEILIPHLEKNDRT